MRNSGIESEKKIKRQRRGKRDGEKIERPKEIEREK